MLDFSKLDLEKISSKVRPFILKKDDLMTNFSRGRFRKIQHWSSIPCYTLDHPAQDYFCKAIIFRAGNREDIDPQAGVNTGGLTGLNVGIFFNSESVSPPVKVTRISLKTLATDKKKRNKMLDNRSRTETD